jgi:hypothetical protein
MGVLPRCGYLALALVQGLRDRLLSVIAPPPEPCTTTTQSSACCRRYFGAVYITYSAFQYLFQTRRLLYSLVTRRQLCLENQYVWNLKATTVVLYHPPQCLPSTPMIFRFGGSVDCMHNIRWLYAPAVFCVHYRHPKPAIEVSLKG